jgi:carotenoid 1,2-hydratase
LSDDRAHGLTIIAFVGSVFSPYYAKARRSGQGEPENFCAINVALYGRAKRWAMTERGHASLARDAAHFSVGPSSMRWDNGALIIDIDEVCVPIPMKLKGRVRLTPNLLYDEPVALDALGRHHWRAVAPASRIEVDFAQPGVTWSGQSYHDMNWGEEPLERGFRSWCWSRVTQGEATFVHYDAIRRDGTTKNAALRFVDGRVEEPSAPAMHALPKGLWRMPRAVRSSAPPRLIASLEDTPFYTRNHVAVTLDGREADGVHESLSLDRFDTSVVQAMLPFRMPRKG